MLNSLNLFLIILSLITYFVISNRVISFYLLITPLLGRAILISCICELLVQIVTGAVLDDSKTRGFLGVETLAVTNFKLALCLL